MLKHILISLFVISLAGGAVADTGWIASGPDPNNWNLDENWNEGVPENSEKTLIHSGSAECQVTDAQSGAGAVDLGSERVLRILDGGILSNSGWFAVGYNNNGHMIVEEGGIAHIGSHLWMAAADPAADNCTLDINGGIVNVGGNFGMGTVNASTPSGGIAFVNVKLGTLNLSEWNETQSIQDGSVLDVSFGTVNIEGDEATAAQDYYTAGKLTAFGGEAVPKIVYDPDTDITSITAEDPMAASPTMGETVLTGEVVLNWTNKDPMTGSDPVVDVWFSTDPAEPNVFTKVVDGVAGKTNVTVNAPTNGKYYWQVSLVGSSNPDPNSPLYFFTASNDFAPSDVDAGKDMITWINEPVQLGGEVQLGGTYTDDGVSDVTVTWSSDDPNVIFSPSSDGGATSNAVNPLVSVDYAVENVVLTFTVGDDLNDPVSDIMVLDVYEDQCQAARIGDNRAAVYQGDLTGPEGVPDCVIDIYDLAEEIAGKWLFDYKLTDPQ